MALQSSGAISLNDIATEFGGSTPHSISEYYGVATGVPSSGEISFDDFYGTSNAVTVTLSNGNTNVNASSSFGSNFSSSVAKVLVIPSGAEIGATGGTGNRAITVPSGMGGTLNIQNSGTISGAGGTGSTNSNAGGPGGSAIFIASSNVTVTNSGTIRGGGGGGGKGNDGGPGVNGYIDGALQCYGGAGGAGGNGGNGQGYNSPATSGQAGAPGGAINPQGSHGSSNAALCALFSPFYAQAPQPGGTGSNGGDGGSFGNAGSNSDRSNGGAAGKYIELSGVSYTLSNSGTLTGNAP